MATRSKQHSRYQEKFDLEAIVQDRSATLNADFELVNSTDQPRVDIWCKVTLKPTVDGEKDGAAGQELKITKYDVSTPYDQELYTIMRSELVLFEFDDYQAEVTTLHLWPSVTRPREIRFIAVHGLTDFSKLPS